MRNLLIPIVGVVLGLSSTYSVATAEVPLPRQSELLHLLKHDCGSCHGMRLEGGLGPALKPARLQHWTPEQLAITILHGRPGTPMPPWRPFLSDEEAVWLAQQLKQGVKP